MKTKRGIYTNIKESEYTYSVFFNQNGVHLDYTFYFSSEFYRNKFENRHKEEIHRFNRSLNNVYKDKFDIVADPLAWIRLYCLIEKRGFYIIINNGVEITCPEDLRFVVIPTYNPK